MRTDGSEIQRNRDGERGAAMVMALLISFLLIAGSAGLILSTSMNSANVTDLTSEQQAYAAAESGIQSVVNVLRYKCTAAVSPCKVRPNPLLDTSQPDYHRSNTISYVRALTNATSNSVGDTSPSARLSRWINYDSSSGQRVKIAEPGVTYDPATGHAYSVSITDPDNTGNVVSFSTWGRFYYNDGTISNTITYGTAPNQVIITFTPNTVTNLAIPNANEATNYGKFNIQITGTGAEITTVNRFEIAVNMSKPYIAQRKIRGFIMTNAGSYTTPPKILYDSETYDIRGSLIDLDLSGYAFRTTGAEPYGYEGDGVLGDNVVTGTISAPEPDRLLVRSVGYGPRGAKKELEAIIQSNYFSGLGAPATITMVGNDTGPNGDFLFDPGSSNAMLYSGVNAAAGESDVIPPIGVTTDVPLGEDDPNLQHVLDAVDGHIANNVQGVPSNVRGELPPWMIDPQTLDATIKNIYETALNTYDPTNPLDTGRVFSGGQQPTSWGDNASGTGITFCDGDCELGPVAGGGLLVVTGQLTLHGNFSFNGLIIVTGGGGIIRTGGGTGMIQGNIIVAPYENSDIAGDTDPADDADFWAPRWDTQGGGNSDIRYNSNNQANSLNAISNNVLGIVEK